MSYAVWLFGLGVFFTTAERLWPWRKSQPLLRRGLLTDIAYIVFNAEYLGFFTATVAAWLLRLYNPAPYVQVSLMAAQPLWVQAAVLFFTLDLLKWCIHNLLHRVPALWRLHQVHHSIVDMDWIGNWRIHWAEIVVYDLLLYVPMALFGFAPMVLFWNGVVNTFFGHLAHANIRVPLGSLKYVFNSPQMHIWHHTHPDSGPINRNFGLTLSIWDWLFGTAYMPEATPQRLGFGGIEKYPRDLPAQWLAPFLRRYRQPN